MRGKESRLFIDQGITPSLTFSVSSQTIVLLVGLYEHDENEILMQVKYSVTQLIKKREREKDKIFAGKETTMGSLLH